MKYFSTLLVCLMLLAAPASSAVQRAGLKYGPEGTPLRAIQNIDDRLGEFRSAPSGGTLSAADEEFNRQLKQSIIRGTFDAWELSRLALAKHWEGLSEQERNRFVDIMTSLLEEKALFSREQSAAKSREGGKYRVIYKGESYADPQKSKALVRTMVVVPSEKIDINLNYRLKKIDGTWKVYDIVVDEASLVSNYRYQFDSIIAKGGYQDLVNRMSKKLDEIRGKRQVKGNG